jgi:hypothetical protein
VLKGVISGFMEEEASIACSWEDASWRKLAITCALATLIYTIQFPVQLGWIFYSNRESALRGEINYMRRYGFLLKPYKNHSYYWEIFNIARKGLLSLIIKLSTDNPTMCAVYAMGVLGFIIAHQSRVRPYKYDKHNSCAIQVLTTSFLNFFSSLIFISEGVCSMEEKKYLLILNTIMIVVSFTWCFTGMSLDFFNFFRYLWFTTMAETKGRAALEAEAMWANVDKPGLITLAWYDPIVVRNRFQHTVTRERVLGPRDGAEAQAVQAAIERESYEGNAGNERLLRRQNVAGNWHMVGPTHWRNTDVVCAAHGSDGFRKMWHGLRGVSWAWGWWRRRWSSPRKTTRRRTRFSTRSTGAPPPPPSLQRNAVRMMDRPRPGWPPLPASCQPADAAARRRSSLAPPGGLADTSRPTSRASRPAPSPPTSRRCWRRSARSSRRAPSRARSASARSSHSPAAGTLPVATTAGNPQRLASHARVRWRIDLYAVARIRVKADLWKGRDSSGLQTVTTLVSIERRVHWRDCRQMPTHPACSRCYTWPPQVCRRKATTPQPRLIGALIADR